MQAIHRGAFLKHGVASLAALAFLLCAAPTLAESIVTVAMTAGDIPITTGIPDQGGEAPVSSATISTITAEPGFIAQ